MSLYISQSTRLRNSNQTQYLINYSQILFHKEALSKVKRSLGPYCTFLSHYTTKSNVGFMAHLLINNKIKKIKINSEVTNTNEFSAKTYNLLKTQLEDYVQGKETI